eukprot:g11503.t2
MPLLPGRRLRERRRRLGGSSLVLLSLSLGQCWRRTSTAAAATPATCGRRLVSEEDDQDGARGLLLSRGRGYMGAAMVDDPGLVLFAGGIGMEGTVVDSSVDAFSVPGTGMPLAQQPDSSSSSSSAGGENGDLLVAKDVFSLGVARTDMGAAATTSALFFAGGCGMDISQQDGSHKLGPEIVENGGGAGGGVVDPDVPLLLKNCQATDAVDVFSLPGGAGAGAGSAAPGGEGGRAEKGRGEGKGLPLVASADLRLCEPKYAAAVGVFYTGEAAGETDPDKWPPTAHVLVAGGIVPMGDAGDVGGYTATDTVDILREDGIDEVTGEAKISSLSVPRLPNPPRFEMTSCCFKHQCVFAGGRVSMGQGGVGFNSDRAEVWDGATWSFATWGEHTLSEPRHLMGSAVIEISAGADKRTVGFFAGGVSNTGDSSMVDMFDFDERRVLPRMYAPTISGPTQGVSLSREVAAFVGATGKIDVFDGRTLCWVSYEAEGFLPGTGVVGRSAKWFFDGASPGFQPSGAGSLQEEASAFVGGGVAVGAGGGEDDVSRDVQELRWWRIGNGKMQACLGGEPLRQLEKVCGLPGPDGSIQAFTPHDEDWPGDPDDEPAVSGPAIGSAAAPGGNGVSATKRRATLIVRKVEGLWRLPFGGGVFEALCEGVAQCWRGFCRHCCCCCCLLAREGSTNGSRTRSIFSNGKAYGQHAAAVAGEGSRLIFPPDGGDIEDPRRPRRGRSGRSNGDSTARSSSLSRRGTRTTPNYDAADDFARPRARSDSSGDGGGREQGGGGGGGRYGSGSAGGVPVAASGRSRSGSGSSGGGRSRSPRASSSSIRKKRGGGVQILAASAVDAAAAAARLAAEIANDGDDEGR